MVATLNWLTILAAEAHGIPGSDWRAKVAVPVGVLVFFGSVYLLVRSNLGTRRGYLVMATSWFGFMIIYSLFWAFGAPGTPPATGPQTLPGQELDAYEDTWRAFAGDSLIAEDPDYAVAKTYPEGFSDSPEEAGLPAGFTGTADTGADDIQTFFSDEEGPMQKPPVGPQWGEVDRKYAQARNGRPILAVTYQQTWQVGQLPQGEQLAEGESPPLTPDGENVEGNRSNVAPEGTEIGDIVEDGETYTAFGYFDAGSPMFPSLVVFGIIVLLFALHAVLLAADERRERREREALAGEAAAAQQRTPEPAGRR
ncbi:MAG: hypothetical protein GEU74_04220 [Nitriliruptorales bacterium]|nr:hypothetical protein [Nitriliruptorales bacterium]